MGDQENGTILNWIFTSLEYNQIISLVEGEEVGWLITGELNRKWRWRLQKGIWAGGNRRILNTIEETH